MNRCLALGLLLATGACGPENPRTVRDTTGVVFGWECGRSGCSPSTIEGTTPPASAYGSGLYSLWGMFAGRLVLVCPAAVQSGETWWTNQALCRGLACEADANCPAPMASATTTFTYQCVNSLCQDTAKPLHNDQATALCLAEARREDAPVDGPLVQGVIAELAKTCPSAGETCSVPLSCRQP